MQDIRSLTELVESPQRDVIYQILKRISLRLCVDVGAAAGDTTRLIRQAGSTRIVAFEPFPNNHRHFEEHTHDLVGVELVKKAVSDRIGTESFFVRSTVTGTEPGWEQRHGYSSVGHLAGSRVGWLLNALRISAARVAGNRGASLLRVPTTTLEAEFPTDVLDLLKIDVQGAESRVLAGALPLLREQRVRFLYVEWAGDQAVLKILSDNGYTVYDTLYVGHCRNGSSSAFERAGFEVTGHIPLSTGVSAFEMRRRCSSVGIAKRLRRLNARGLRWLQTDLIAVRQVDVAVFEQACRKMGGG